MGADNTFGEAYFNPSMRVDVVIPLYYRSLHDYMELKYALRAVEKYLSGISQVFIIGNNLPPWITNVIQIKVSDNSPYSSVNIKDKILTACHVKAITEDFILLNDDHFLLHDFNVQTLPYYFQHSLSYKALDCKQPYYFQQLVNTMNVLKDRALPILHYDIHFPIRFNKSKFIEMCQAYDWSIEQGYAIKSLYCNTFGITGVPSLDLNIMRPCRSIDVLNDMLEGRTFFSTHEGAIDQVMESKWKELYPMKSKFEK